MTDFLCVIATGTRHADTQTWRETIKAALSGPDVMGKKAVLIHGNQRGIDTHVAKMARMYGWQVIPVDALFKKEGKSAGPRRNRSMAKLADILAEHDYEVRVYAFHDRLWERSTGTLNMVEVARRYGFPVTLFRSDGTKEDIS